MTREDFDAPANAAIESAIAPKEPKPSKLPQIIAYLAFVGTYIAAVFLGITKISFTTGNGASAVEEELI